MLSESCLRKTLVNSIFKKSFYFLKTIWIIAFLFKLAFSPFSFNVWSKKQNQNLVFLLCILSVWASLWITLLIYMGDSIINYTVWQSGCLQMSNFKSSNQRCSIKKGALKNFAKFTRKHLCQSLFFDKVVGLRPATLLKEKLWHRWLPVNFAILLRATFLGKTSGRLLLNFIMIAEIKQIIFLRSIFPWVFSQSWFSI